jgi:hypothetical protein
MENQDEIRSRRQDLVETSSVVSFWLKDHLKDGELIGVLDGMRKVRQNRTLE